MSFRESLAKHLTKFGENNSPTLVAMGLATAKGIFRPTFTMMDKKENYDTKRYTAIREGLTELIAIPVYYLSGVASTWVTKKLATPKHFMPKDVYKKYSEGDTSEAVRNAFSNAEEMSKNKMPKIKSVTAFIGVCLSALIVIPLVCSLTIKPIMKSIEKKGSSKEKKPAEINNETILPKPAENLNTFKGLYGRMNCGMKVGGV